MTRYSSYRPKVEHIPEKRRQPPKTVRVFVPISVVGTGLTAALMVLLLLTQSQLSQISFEISALEQELGELETRHEKLLISRAKAYSLERIEYYAINDLGMIHPNPDQIRYIDTAEDSRKEPE